MKRRALKRADQRFRQSSSEKSCVLTREMCTLWLIPAILAVAIHPSLQADFGNWQGIAQNFRNGNAGFAAPQDNTCEKLPCNFNDGQSCGYELGDPNVLNPTQLTKQAFGSWYLSSKLPSNFALQLANGGDGEGRLPPSGGYVVAQGFVGSRFSKYSFRTPRFAGGFGNTLRFRYHGRAPGTVLKVCTSDQRSCQVAATFPKDILKNWQEGRVSIPFGASQIDFVAFDLGAGLWVAVDNIRVVKNGRECSQK